MVQLIGVNKVIGQKKILSDVNLAFENGVVYGISGINGSGKTMLMKAICGLVLPSSGNVIIAGKKVNKVTRFPESIGVLIENPVFLPYYTGYENLKLLAGIKNIISSEQIKEEMVRVGLDINDDKKFRKYSLGMKQKLGIAAAVMEKPDILLLDEPFNGIDATGVELVKKIIREEKERGALIIITCHDKEIFDEVVDIKINISEGVVSLDEASA